MTEAKVAAQGQKSEAEPKGYRVGEYQTRKRGKVPIYLCTTPKCRYGTLSEKAIQEHVAAGHDEYRRRRRRQR